MLYWAVGGFLSAIGFGTQAITSRRFGEEKFDSAGAVVPNALLVTLVGGGLLSAGGWVAMPLLFRTIVANPRVAELGAQYARWRFVGITSMAATAAYKGFFDGIGKTHLHLWAAIAMNVFNAALCWVLIFGHFGFPRMGIQGAGVAACTSSWLGVLVMAGFSVHRRYNERYRFYQSTNLSPKLTYDLLRLSVPSGIATVVVMTGFLLFLLYRLVPRTRSSLRCTCQTSCPSCTYFLSRWIWQCPRSRHMSLPTVPQPRSSSGCFRSPFSPASHSGRRRRRSWGKSLGARDPELAESYAWTSVKLGAAIFGVVGIAMFLWAPSVMGIFTHAYPVIRAGSTPLRIVSAMGPVIAVGMILTQALYGAGETRYVMMVEFGLHFGCLVPAAWLLGLKLHLGLPGIWSAVALYATGLAIFMSVKFARGAWKKISV